MDPQSREVLELEKVEAILAAKTSSPYGARRAGELRPFGDADLLDAELRFVQELKDVAAAHGRPFELDLPDLDETLRRCRTEGARLEAESLLRVSKTLSISEQISAFAADRREEYPELAGRARELLPAPMLREAIDRCIDPVSSAVMDACSRHLRDVRREKERVRAQTLQSLEKILAKRSAKTEEIITIRSDRYVIPVDSHHRSAVRGIVHDTSSSGATLFVEPLEVVELNNRLRALGVMEKEEEQRILWELTERVRDHAELIETDIEVIGEIDFVWAKARFSAEFRCVRPVISDRGMVRLVGARHPLLVISRGDDRVVPLDLVMGEGYRVLVISGPNMGGKTVALKTVGLLAVMMACGLHIPAADGSELPLFQEVYADIGDWQSIEEDLSTFAAHVRQLARITKGATEGSLVLLDEIGAGTDPHEGGALARAILKFLADRRAFCVATTHLGTLKPFVAENDSMVNACMEFDADTLRPLYALHVGSPGRSMALEIAGQLGLPDKLLGDAREQLSASELRMDALLAEADRSRVRARELEEEAETARREARELRGALEERVEGIKARRKDLEREARRRCREMVAQARRDLDALLAEAKKSGRAERVRRAWKRADALESQWTEKEESSRPPAVDLAPGSEVWVDTLGVGATFLKMLPNGRAMVERRGVRMEVPASELKQTEDGQSGRPVGSGYAAPEPRESAAEAVVRGMTGDEAVEAIEGYLDAALLQGLSEIKIIHGKGKGVLRNRISRFLTSHSAVESFRLGEIWEGGAGVTVVKLK